LFGLANHHHERDLSDFGVANFPSDLFIAVINEGANIGIF
jgi:hypothetical protein